MNAIFNNDLPGVKKALAAGTNPNTPAIGGGINSSFLIIAIGINPAIAQALITAGANLNFQGSTTALIESANHENLELVKLLLAKKVNVDFQSNQGATALIMAANNGNLEIVKLLLAAGANPNLQTNSANGSATALTSAAIGNFTSVVEALAKAPTISQSINKQDSTGATVLIYAAQAGNTAMVKALASIKGINANIQDNTGMTALMYASSNNNEKINGDLLPLLKLLVKIPGINLNVINNHMNESVQCGPDGCAALDYALSEDYYNFLTNSGANPTL